KTPNLFENGASGTNFCAPPRLYWPKTAKNQLKFMTAARPFEFSHGLVLLETLTKEERRALTAAIRLQKRSSFFRRARRSSRQRGSRQSSRSPAPWPKPSVLTQTPQ